MSTQEDAVLQELIQRALAYPDGGISAEAEAEAAAEAAELAAEAVLSDSRRWPAGLRRLLDGPPPAGGDAAYPSHAPDSATGLLCGVAPMLLHRSAGAEVWQRGDLYDEHVERPARMVAVYDTLLREGLVGRAKLIPARPAARSDLELVHSRSHARRAVRRYEGEEEAHEALGLQLGADTYFAAGESGRAALLSCGSVVELATRVVTGELSNALAVVRPPGHHCEARQAMGFCILNNVAVAAAVARARLGVQRVLIVDWDVHHGNGIQHIFEEDGSVLYASLHRYGHGFYPGTGGAHAVGEGAGRGFSLNIPWRSAGYGDAEYAAAFERLLMPVAREFAPELVLVAAGFDAAARDPLGGMEVSPAGYAYMTAQLRSLAAGQLVVALEGGYNLRSISSSAAAVMRVLLGDDPPPLPPAPPCRSAARDIAEASHAMAPFWRSVAAARGGPKAQPRSAVARPRLSRAALRELYGTRAYPRRRRRSRWPFKWRATTPSAWRGAARRRPAWHRLMYGDE